MTWRISDPCQICPSSQNPRKGSFNTTAESENDLPEIRQSAYRKNHSTETVLLSVVDGLLKNADDRLVSVPALLDLSAASDMLDHPILLQRLETTFGISGTVLHWFASYLEGREQSVMVDNVLSSPSNLQFRVPQGSVLGPILFTLYSQPLSDLICRHECDYHKYADDTQLSKGAPPDQFQSLLCDIQTCTESVVDWMYSNKLKLNAEKTEVLPVASTSHLSSVQLAEIAQTQVASAYHSNLQLGT